VAGFHESWPIVYGEEAFGFARTGQTMLAVPDATVISLYVDDERCFYRRRASSSSSARSIFEPACWHGVSCGRRRRANAWRSHRRVSRRSSTVTSRRSTSR
jgi:hypothetical protein